LLEQHLQGAPPDLLRQMIASLANAMMSAQADQVCGAAAYGERSAERTNRRSGYRAREWDTRAGTVELAIPKLRAGWCFPDWLLERRKRAERALTTVVATCYLLGVSTRRMERLVETLGITRLSKVPGQRDGRGALRARRVVPDRPLDAGPYTLSARAGGSSTSMRCWRPGSTPTGTGRSSA
jgi:putative transposase